MISRRAALTAGLSLTGGLVAGCGSQEALGGSDHYDLTVWVYSDFVQGESGTLMSRFVDEFRVKHPNVRSVNLIPKNDAELLASLTTGVGLPDAFSASARDAKKYHGAIDLVNLRAVFSDDPAYAKGFYPEALDTVTVDGGVWAIPFISYVPVIYRNLTVLNKAGVDSSAGIPTYEAFLQQLRRVHAAGIDATHSWANGGYLTVGSVMASDARTITPGERNGRTTITPQQLTRTFRTVAEIEKYANTSLSYDDDVTLEAFKTNRLGHLVGGPWIEPALQESGVKYDFDLVPAYSPGGWTGGMQGWDFFYGVRSDDETRNRLVADWLQLLGSAEAQRLWTTKVGRPTLREDVMEDPSVIQASPMAKVSSAGLKNGMIQMDYMDSLVFWPDALSDPGAELGRGAITPAEAAAQTVDGINELYAEAGED